MARNSSTIKLISYGLAAVYLLSLLAYCPLFMALQFRFHEIVLALLFLFLCVAAITAAGLQEWARRSLVITNAVLFVFLFGLYFSQPNVIAPGYLFLCVITVLFYSQDATTVLFVDKEASTRKSILIVDDDPGLLKSVKPVLLAKGFSVLTAMTGEKGLQIVRRQKPDLIILDVILPGIKGRQVCMKLKESPDTQRIPVIFLTAKDSPDDVKAELAAGGIAHITKPFTPQKLLEEIQKALGSE